MLTVPLGTGAISALVFLIFELLVLPVLMYSTSQLASIFVAKHVKRGKIIRVKAFNYALWNEGLFGSQVSHALLFMVRIICIVIPVYLETRFITQTERQRIPTTLANAFIVRPKQYDVLGNETTGPRNPDTVLMPGEVFYRCADVNEDGWLTARMANISVLENGRRRVQCISGTEQPIYRRIQTLPPFVKPTVTESNPEEATAIYTRPLIMEVHYDEGPSRAFPPWPHVQFEPDERVLQVKNVMVRDQINMECFQWRAIVRAAPERSQRSELFRRRSFVCQNVTGNMVDFYAVDTKNAATNTSIISTQNGNDALVSKLNTSMPLFTFIARLEFQERMWVNGGVIARQHFAPVVGSSSSFDFIIKTALYTEATNVTVDIPGEEVTRTTLDAVVIIVGLTEVFMVLLFGLIIAMYSRFRWANMQTVNTVDGLSQSWRQYNAAYGQSEAKKNGRVTLRLRKRTGKGNESFFVPIGVEEIQTGEDMANARVSAWAASMTFEANMT